MIGEEKNRTGSVILSVPSISVIIPAYNSEPYLGEALKSVFEQDYCPMEVIVVDDGSTDNTRDVALSFPVIYIYQSNKGPAAARNKGIGISSGDFIAFIDADDVWPPNRIKCQVPYLLDHQSTDVVLGRTRLTGTLTVEEKEKIRFEGPDNTMIDVVLGSGLFRKFVFDKVGCFDETLRYYEDHDWFLRAREKGVSIIIIKRVTLIRRRHENSMSKKRKSTDPTMFQVLKKSLERRRKQHKGVVPSLKMFFDFDEKKIL